MGIFGKIFKRHDDVDFDSLVSKETGLQDNLGLPPNPAISKSPFDSVDSGFNQPAASPPMAPSLAPSSAPGTPTMGNRDLELISSKLDTLKAMLHSIEQRLSHVEKTVGADKKEPKLW